MEIKLIGKKGCGLCNMAKGRAKQYSNVELLQLDDDENLIEKYNIEKIPTLVVGDKNYTTLKDIYDKLKEKGVKNGN